LQFALARHESIFNPYATLSYYIDAIHDEKRGLILGETVLDRLAGYLAEKLQGILGLDLVAVVDDIAKRQFLLKRYMEAETSYRKALEILENNHKANSELKKKGAAAVWHQLGYIAQEQRQWAQAEDYYRKALAIHIEFNDRYSQTSKASTYHQLGRVAEEQRQWARAEDYYQKALAIFIEFNDHASQARPYHQLGNVAQEQRQWTQAEDYYRKALAIYVKFNDHYEQASAYHQLGRVAQEQRQWALAEDYYRKALALKIEFNYHYEQASTYHQLGMVAQEQRQSAQAGDYYLKSLAIFVEYQDEYSLRIVLNNLARLWKTGEAADLPGKVAEALGTTAEEVAEGFEKLTGGPPDAGE
jgi:tetratricopeptide (TPR) repeat protein